METGGRLDHGVQIADYQSDIETLIMIQPMIQPNRRLDHSTYCVIQQDIIMAKSQTRRSVSLPRPIYDRIRTAARSQGITLTELVERALRSHGLTLPEVPHQSAEAVETMKRARGWVL